MERGLLRFLILDSLQAQPRHGYEIIKSLEERTGGRYAPSAGAIYPTLQLLDDQNLVATEQQGSRRLYALTDAGRAELAAHADTVATFWAHNSATNDTPSPEAAFLRDEIGDLMRTVRGVAAGADEATLRAVREALEACERTIRDLVARPARAEAVTPADAPTDAPTTL